MKLLLVSALLVLSVVGATGQTILSSKVNVDFRNADINTIATKLEQQADIKFYFDDPVQFDSVSFTVSGQMTLTQILDRMFANSDFSYAVYKSKYIIVTKGDRIYTTSKEYSQRKQAGRATQHDDSAQIASNENKLYVIGVPGAVNSAKSFILSGYIRDEKTGERVVAASVQINNPVRRVVTDEYGSYTIEIPAGKHVLRIESLGMNDHNISIAMHDNGKLDFELNGRVTTLKSVVISREKLNNIRNAQMGSQRIDIKTIKQVPVVLGETDVFKVITMLPGVKTVGEASTGLNVRGGASDQNLLMYNDATIYNPAHFFGMFSAFNPDVVKDVVLYKSSMPARYGGRLSSVVDIRGKEGNKKEFSGNVGFGPLTGRVMLEGPVIKDRTSFIAAARATFWP
ncbi:MAG: carboxypeptidase-like regulatory domain-containing protein [Chitinophagaceae bacterium]|nr:carboxypeptidase-like regulatory domain-containing protein [Chitinophagaceae bacterium]